MSERKRKRGRPRQTPILSYGAEREMRNSISRVIKKPKYLQLDDEEGNNSRSASPSRSLDSGGDTHNKQKNKRGYNLDYEDKDSEYLYGSDFELEDEPSDNDDKDESRGSSDFEESDIEYADVDNLYSDGEQSVSSYGINGGSTPNRGYPYARPRTPIPVWLQDRDYPPMDLPKSSDELLLPHMYLLKAVGIYEILRHFRTLVRLSPFRFEDFCACLMAEEQSSLLAEVHMMLLKALIREEDSQQTHFGPLDQKDSINVVLYFIDALTWPENLRLYLQSDKEFHSTVEILNTCDYPYTSLENRLQVLQFLCDQFLLTSSVREDLLSEGKVRYDDHCRSCHKTGDLLCCDSCSAVYHLDCVDPPLTDIPGEMEDWTCTVCTAHQLEGITDCVSPMETSGLLCRQDPLGFDRHGRKYWFIVRRLFIENEEGDTWYYSTWQQLEEVLSLLDPADLEEHLHQAIMEILQDMRRQMQITEHITMESKDTRKSCLELEDAESKLRMENMKIKMEEMKIKMEQEHADSLIEEVKSENSVKMEPPDPPPPDGFVVIKDETLEKPKPSNHSSALDPITGEIMDDDKSALEVVSKEIKKEDEEVEIKEAKTDEPKVKEEGSIATKEEGMATRTRTGTIIPKSFTADDLRRRLPGGETKEKSKKVDDEQRKKMAATKRGQLQNSAQIYRLGCDGKYKSFVNQYTTNALAQNKIQHNEERDKRRHLSHKFSLTAAADFKWNGVLHGNKENLISTLRHTILSLESTLSVHLFHPHWVNIRKAWNLAVMASNEPRHFSRVLMWLLACIKPTVLNPVWHDSLGHVRFRRVTALEREEKKKQEKRDKKDGEIVEEPRPVTLIKYTLGLKHQVWKLKGEEYRVHGLWGWQWNSAFRKTPHVPQSSVGLRAGPEKYMVPIKNTAGLRTLSLNAPIYKQLAAKTPSLQPTLLSPKRQAELAATEESPPDEKKNEIIISSPSGQNKVEVGKVNLEDYFEDGLINVSKALNARQRFVYPKVAKASSLDQLLSRRIKLREQEMKDLANKKSIGDIKKEEEEDDVDVENDDSDATLSDNSDHENIDEIPDSVRSTIHKQKPAGNLLKDVRTFKIKYEALDEFDGLFPCYSVSCRNGRSSDGKRTSSECDCYSPLCLLKRRTKVKLVNSVKNYRIVTSKPSPFDEVGAHSPVRFTEMDDESDTKKSKTDSIVTEKLSTTTTVTTTSTVTSVNGQLFSVSNSTSQSMDISQIKSEDSNDGRSSRASSEIRVNAESFADIDENSQGSMENKFSVKEELKVYSKESTSGKVFLKKVITETKKKSKIQYKAPQLSNFRIGKKPSGGVDNRNLSVLVLSKWELRICARKGGHCYVSGFNHNAKANNIVWSYPCSRPVFKSTWMFRTACMPTLNSAALQLRILWVCLRWDDMSEKGPSDGRKQITTDVEIIQTEILKRKHTGRFLEKTEYLRRKVTIPFDVPKPVREFTPSQRSGLRKRRRAQSPVNKEPQSVEDWVEEEKLDIWEVRFFGERLERASAVKRSLNEKGENVQALTSSSRGQSPAEIRARMEEQLKIQRANFNQKKAAEGVSLTTPIGGPGNVVKGSVVKLSIGGGAISTVQGGKLQLASHINTNSASTKVVQAGASTIMAVSGQMPTLGKKIMTTRDGRIISVQTTNTPISSQQQSTTGPDGSTISVGSSTIFPVGGVPAGGAAGAPKVQVTAAGNKVIRLQTLSGGSSTNRMILPRGGATATTTIAPRVQRPLAVATTTTSTTQPQQVAVSVGTTTTVAAPAAATTVTAPTAGGSPRMPGQQIQIIRLPDGQLQVRGLLEGQQLIQRPDGKFHLINTKTLPQQQQQQQTTQPQTINNVSTATTAATGGNLLGQTPQQNATPAIQVTQQTKVVQPTTVSVSLNNKAGQISSPVQSSSTTAPTSHVVKVNGQQVLLKHSAPAQDNKQVVTVGASEAAAAGVAVSNAVVSGGPPRQVVVAAPASGQTSPRIKTMLAPDGTCVKTVLPNTTTATATTQSKPAAATPTAQTITQITTPQQQPTATTPTTHTQTVASSPQQQQQPQQQQEMSSTATSTATTTTAQPLTLTNTSPVSVSPGSSLTLRVQVRMTEQGPKTIIQGLQPGVGLTKDHIMAIQQQVRNMLQQYNLQVNQLSPVMALTLHVPSKTSTTVAPAASQVTQQPTQQQQQAPQLQQQQQIQKQQQQQQPQQQLASSATHQTVTVNPNQATTSVGQPAFRSLLAAASTQHSSNVLTVKNNTNGDSGSGTLDNSAVTTAGGIVGAMTALGAVPTQQQEVSGNTTGNQELSTSGIPQSPVNEDKTPAPGTSPQKFVLTPEYIQQTIKSALSKEDLAPEIEEKLMQLQKYNETNKPDNVSSIISTSAIEKLVIVKPPVNNSLKRTKDCEPDNEWDPTDENSALGPSIPRSRPKKARPEPRAPEPPRVESFSSKSKKQTSVAKAEAVDARRKQALQNKLESQLCRHKDLLKKDILKKRAQLEKELQVQIHKELSVARFQLQMLEKNKPETAMSASLSSPRKKKTASESWSSNVQSSPTASTISHQPQDVSGRLSQQQSPLSPPHHRGPSKHHQQSQHHQSQSNSHNQQVTTNSSKSSTVKTAGSSKKASRKSNKKVVCICRTVFDDSKFYVGCDLCGNWFHGDCVGITENMSRSMTEYVCDDCANAKLNKELFCFCRQPYDETQFYICCEQCEDWYHGKCIGIMQVEADDIDDYICPKCDSSNNWNYPCQKNLSGKDYTEIRKLTKGLIQHKNAWPFLEPVDPSEVPDYYKVVKEPMDLKTVEQRVEASSYQRLAQFIGDVMAVFDNCRLYNPPNSSFCSCAAQLETFFCHRLRPLKLKLNQRQ